MSNKDSTPAAVRPLKETDIEGFAAILRWSALEGFANFETVPPDPAEIARTWAHRRERYPYFVAETPGPGGGIAGAAWASPWKPKPAYAWTAEVSVYVLPASHRRGLGRGLYERLFPLLRAQGYRMLIAGVALPNEPSIKLHESFGMTKAAHFAKNGFKMGGWRDVGYWTLHFDGPDPPPPVLDVAEGTSRLASGPGPGNPPPAAR